MSDTIKLASLQSCTGCAACYNACAHNAILMEVDKEGFHYPSIDEKRCVECGLCMKSCPVISPAERKIDKQRTYAVWNKTDRDLSSSGGAFSAFARFVISKGGVVFGAAFDKEYHLRHIAVDSVKELSKLRGSKYVQSYIGDSYRQVKQLLKSNRLILFTGTPCQVAGLYAYLGKRYERLLITLDLVCHGVPSEGTFLTYLSKLSHNLHEIDSYPDKFMFRKLSSWDYRPTVWFKRKKVVLRQEQNVYMMAFFKGYIYRESCFRCRYANLNRVGTYTIADFWGIGRHGIPFDKSIGSGISLVIENCQPQDSLMDALKNYTWIEERCLQEAIIDNTSLREPVKRTKERNTAILDMLDDKVSLSEYGKRYNLLEKKDVKYYVKYFIKEVLYVFHLYNFFKNLSYKLK